MSDQEPAPAPTKNPLRKWIVAGIVMVAVVIGVFIWIKMKPSGPGEGFVSGNGRIEATEVDIATKLAGRVEAIMVDEGDFVALDQPLAEMPPSPRWRHPARRSMRRNPPSPVPSPAWWPAKPAPHASRRTFRTVISRHRAPDVCNTGLPGIAWLKLDKNAVWPDDLKIKVPE